MAKLFLPAAPAAGSASKLSANARFHSRGKRAAKASLAVIIFISAGEKVLQYIRTP